MSKENSFVPGSQPRNRWLIALVCAISLGASACGGLPSNSLTPTPTTLMGVLQSQGQSAVAATELSSEVPTETPASNNGDQEDLVDICPLITQEEAEAVLGQPVISINPGMDQDSVSGGTLYYCNYLGTGLAVVISLVDMGSSEDAKQAMGEQLAKMLSDDASTTSAQESGLGDQAYWSTTEHAVQNTVVKGNYIFSVMIGGNVGDPAAYQAALLNLAMALAKRI
jgi:hypothetical protein